MPKQLGYLSGRSRNPSLRSSGALLVAALLLGAGPAMAQGTSAASAKARAAKKKPKKGKRGAKAEAATAELHQEMVQLLKARKGKRAVVLGEECLELDPSHADCHLQLGIAYAGLGQPEKGVKYYQKFLELAPDAPSAPKVREVLEEYAADHSEEP